LRGNDNYFGDHGNGEYFDDKYFDYRGNVDFFGG